MLYTMNRVPAIDDDVRSRAWRKAVGGAIKAFWVVAAALGAIAGQAQTATPLLAADTIATVGGYNDAAAGDAVKVVPAAGTPFATALRINRAAAGTNSYDAALAWPTRAAVRKGDLLVATFYVRSLGDAGAALRLQPSFQLADAPYTASLLAGAPVDTGSWQRYAIPFRATIDYPSGAGSFQLRYGAARQAFEVGGITVESYGQVADIPPALAATFAFYYPDRGNPTAAWRTSALAAIEATRKTDLIVRVVDAAGRPVPAANVIVTMSASAFHWGSAVSANAVTCSNRQRARRPCLNLPEADRLKYRAAAKTEFSELSLYNDLKWPEWEADPARALDAMTWVGQTGRAFARGHNLVWPGFEPDYKLPGDIRPGTPADMVAARTLAHIADELGRTRGRVAEWDVVNEPYDNHDLQGRIATSAAPAIAGVLPTTAIIDWYKAAAIADPAARLFLNDYAIFDGLDPAHRAYDVALIDYLKAGGARVDAIGFQGHFGHSAPVFTDMTATLALFDPRVAAYAVTEFDFETIDPAMQADVMRDTMIFVFGSPKFTGFQMWGFWDGDHWLGSAPLFDRNWVLKPSGAVWRELRRKWTTNVTLRADASGMARARVFKGTYNLRVVDAAGKVCRSTGKVLTPTTLTLSTGC